MLPLSREMGTEIADTSAVFPTDLRSAMTSQKRPNLNLVELVAGHYRAMLKGALLGAVVGLGLPTAARFLRAGSNQVASFAVRTALWPSRGWLFLLVILLLTLILCAQSVVSFCRRLLASWRVQPSRGLFVNWLIFSPFALLLISHGRYTLSALLLVLSMASSLALLAWGGTRAACKPRSDVDPDVPIESWEQDILGRKSALTNLAGQVASGVASVIALVGGYGEGKTSSLNLLIMALRVHHPDVVVAPYISSLATSKEVLIGTLFNSITKELRKRSLGRTLPDGLTRYASSIVGAVPRFGGALKELFRVPSQDDQIRQLRRSLEGLGTRVVVVVDDMDRMHADELELLLKLMRGAPEFPNLTYVCAFDKEALARELSRSRMSLDDARHYLEKFFPVQAPLPRIDPGILSHEFDKRFEALCRKYGLLTTEEEQRRFNEEFPILWQVHLNHWFSNLRRIKLFFNRVTTAVAPIAEEINLTDFVLLEIIRDLAPDIYEKIYIHRRYFFYGKWRVETWLETVHPDDGKEKTLRKEFLDALLQPLDSEKRELVTELLCRLFPAVGEYRRPIPPAGADPLESKKERRIFHPAFFARYFIFGVQTDEFGEAEFKRLVSDLNRCDDSESCRKRFRAEFGAFPAQSFRRRNFLDQLATKIDSFGAPQAEAVGIAIAELSDQLEPPILGLAEAETARRAVFTVANGFAGSSKVQDFLEATIHAATADYFAALVLAACEDPTKNQILTNWENVKLNRLGEAFRARMKQKYFPGGTASICEPANQRGLMRSLNLWAKAGGTEEIRSFLTDEFGRRPQSLGILIKMIFPMEASQTLDQLKGLSQLYPLDELEAWVDRLGTAAYSSPEGRSAIARFSTLLASARMAKLKFKLADASPWSATREDGSVLNCVNGQVVDDVKLADDGLPAEKIFRDAVVAGIAEIIPPPSWTKDGARIPSKL
jgi:hypothetical protein